MAFEITRVDVWAGEVEDRAGALADILESVLRAEADLDFVLVRPLHEKPGTGVVYLAPLYGPEQRQAATEAGLRKSDTLQALRVVGPDRPGLGAGIARTLADAGLNIRGLTAGRLGDRCVVYLRFDSEAELEKAAQVLTPKLA